MKLFSSLTLASLTLAAMPAFCDSVQLITTANMLPDINAVITSNVSDDSATYSYAGSNYNSDETVNFVKNDFGYLLTGSLDVAINQGSGVSDPYVLGTFIAHFLVPDNPGGYNISGTEYQINSIGLNTGITHINFIDEGTEEANGLLLLLPSQFGSVKWEGGPGYQYEDFQLQITPVAFDAAATPEPASFAMMLIPMLAALGFKFRSQFIRQRI